MNNNELENILKDKSLDILEKIYDCMAEDLAKISNEDKIKLEKINNGMEEQLELLKQEFNELKVDKVSKLLSDYIYARDYISAYYNQKYFKERTKDRNKTNCRNNKIKLKASVNSRKTLAFSMKKYVYLIYIHKMKCIYAKSHAFRLLDRNCIYPSSCKIILWIILTGKLHLCYDRN